MKINKKLVISFLVTGVIPLFILGIVTSWLASDGLEKQAFDQLESISEIKKSAIIRYFNNIEYQIETFSEDKMVVNSMRDFKVFFKNYRNQLDIPDQNIDEMRESLKTYYTEDFSGEFNSITGSDANINKYFSQLDEEAIFYQYQYIKNNPGQLGSKHDMDSASFESQYNDLHAYVHPVIKNYLDKFGYYDIFLVDSETGDIVYSVFKELDFATSLKDGPYSNTNFARAFNMANSSTDPSSIHIVDFEQYYPSYEAPASFISSPIFDNGERIGVLLFQMPIDRLNEVMTEVAGLGSTGESYLVGSDHLVRSDTRAIGENSDNNPLSVVNSFRHRSESKLSSKQITSAINGETGRLQSRNYRGDDVFSTYSAVELVSGGLNWGLVVEKSKSEAMKASTHIQVVLIVVLLSSVIGIVIFAIVTAKGISAPIIKTVDISTSIADGDLDQEINLKGAEEITKLGTALNRMLNSLIKNKKDTESRVNNLSTILKTVDSTANSVHSAAVTISDQANSLAQTSTEQAASLEEITSTMTEIGSQSKGNAEKASLANSLASETQDSADTGKSQMTAMVDAMGNINLSSKEISKVVKVIDDIAFQTNLLALNAAVEAARAGNYGKGFAVVADEVRNLAQRSAKAAQETTKLIEDSLSKVDHGATLATKTSQALEDIVNNIKKVTALIGEINDESDVQTNSVSQVAIGLRELEEVAVSNANSVEKTSNACDQLLNESNSLEDILQKSREN